MNKERRAGENCLLRCNSLRKVSSSLKDTTATAISISSDEKSPVSNISHLFSDDRHTEDAISDLTIEADCLPSTEIADDLSKFELFDDVNDVELARLTYILKTAQDCNHNRNLLTARSFHSEQDSHTHSTDENILLDIVVSKKLREMFRDFSHKDEEPMLTTTSENQRVVALSSSNDVSVTIALNSNKSESFGNMRQTARDNSLNISPFSYQQYKFANNGAHLKCRSCRKTNNVKDNHLIEHPKTTKAGIGQVIQINKIELPSKPASWLSNELIFVEKAKNITIASLNNSETASNNGSWIAQDESISSESFTGNTKKVKKIRKLVTHTATHEKTLQDEIGVKRTLTKTVSPRMSLKGTVRPLYDAKEIYNNKKMQIKRSPLSMARSTTSSVSYSPSRFQKRTVKRVVKRVVTTKKYQVFKKIPVSRTFYSRQFSTQRPQIQNIGDSKDQELAAAKDLVKTLSLLTLSLMYNENLADQRKSQAFWTAYDQTGGKSAILSNQSILFREYPSMLNTTMTTYASGAKTYNVPFIEGEKNQETHQVPTEMQQIIVDHPKVETIIVKKPMVQKTSMHSKQHRFNKSSKKIICVKKTINKIVYKKDSSGVGKNRKNTSKIVKSNFQHKSTGKTHKTVKKTNVDTFNEDVNATFKEYVVTKHGPVKKQELVHFPSTSLTPPQNARDRYKLIMSRSQKKLNTLKVTKGMFVHNMMSANEIWSTLSLADRKVMVVDIGRRPIGKIPPLSDYIPVYDKNGNFVTIKSIYNN